MQQNFKVVWNPLFDCTQIQDCIVWGLVLSFGS